MPAPVEGKDDKAEQMWTALKRHIIRERERKKQEREAEVEEERLRKEREAREQQDVMTLGETREQIIQLETKLTQLKEEKHQLFLQLKKVLNEDDNRRRQLVKENENILSIQTLPPGTIVHQPIYLPQNIPRGVPTMPQQGFKIAVKRQRSPSPPPSVVPNSLYHQAFGFKPAVVGGAFQPSPQKEDNRRHDARAVLWNKTPQYTTQQQQHQAPPPPQQQAPPPPSSAATAAVLSAAAAAAHATHAYYPHVDQHHLQLYTRDPPPQPQRSLYTPQSTQVQGVPPGPPQQLQQSSVPQQYSQQQQQQQHHHVERQQQQERQQVVVEQHGPGGTKVVAMEQHYAALRMPPQHATPGAHVIHTVQQTAGPGQPGPQGQSPIKNNYPIRSSPYQQQVLAPGAALYTTQHGVVSATSRLYQASGGPYPPPRD